MNADAAKMILPPGWSVIVDVLYMIMEDYGVELDSLVGVREAIGYPFFMFAPLSVDKFNAVIPRMYDLQTCAHKMCVYCGATEVTYTSTRIPVCRKHNC